MKVAPPSTADYMTIRTSGPQLGGSQMMPSPGSVLGSQMILPASQFGGSQMCISKSDRSVLGSQLLMNMGKTFSYDNPLFSRYVLNICT